MSTQRRSVRRTFAKQSKVQSARMQTASHDSHRFVLLSGREGCPNAARDKAVLLHGDHPDSRLLAAIGLRSQWAKPTLVQQMMALDGTPGTGRGGRHLALIITQQPGSAQQRVPVTTAHIEKVKISSGNLACNTCNDATKIRSLRHRQSLHNIPLRHSTGPPHRSVLRTWIDAALARPCAADAMMPAISVERSSGARPAFVAPGRRHAGRGGRGERSGPSCLLFPKRRPVNDQRLSRKGNGGNGDGMTS